MRKIYLFLTFVLLVPSIHIFAKKRTLEEMRRVAATVSTLQNGSRGTSSLVAAQMNVAKEESQLTVLSTNSLFVVIANDDDFDAVLGYSDSPFDQETLSNPGLRWWIEAMNNALEQHTANGTRPHKVTINPNYKQSVQSFIATKWGQEAPYNLQTPTYSQSGKEYHFVTGCVATAMAQAMKYYNYPATGKGSASYRFNTTTPSGDPITSRVSINFESGNYEWANMQNTYGMSYSPESGNAVAKLMAHCGASVKMIYNKDGSASFIFQAVDALKTRFLYNENMSFYLRDFMHIDEWMDIIFANLSNGYPILVGAQSKTGGHAFVLDGYSSAGLVSVNWGWEGRGDGYFDMASLNGYSAGQEIVPVVLPEVILAFHSSFGFHSNYPPSYKIVMGTLSASASVIVNTDYKNFNGQLGLLAQNLTTGKIIELGSSALSIEGYGVGGELHYAQNINFSKIDISYFADGEYRIYMATKGNTEVSWSPIRSNENLSNSAILSIAGSKVSISSEEPSNWVGMNEIKASATTMTDTYNLSGRKVHPSLRGLYIRNGKKILVK